MARGGHSFWQMLPGNPIGDGFSPYSTISSFAGETLLVSPEALRRDGLLTAKDLQGANEAKGQGTRADFRRARQVRDKLLRLAWHRAQAKEDSNYGKTALAAFQAEEAEWLEPYTSFAAIASVHGGTDFTTWPAPLRDRDPDAVAAFRRDHADEIDFLTFGQLAFARQWHDLKTHAHERGISLLGDLPIFVAARSADVWAGRANFFLDDNGRPTVVAGCPPDKFNAQGQLWGNALYNWEALARDDFRFWIRRIQRMLALFDVVRLDHFIGFYRYWEIPAKAKTAASGNWRLARGEDLFARLKAEFGDLPFIAEDLGAVVPDVRALRDRYHFPGMKVLQFGFDGTEEGLTHTAHRLPPASAVYTGTHDNPTTRGWLAEITAKAKHGKTKGERAAAQQELAATRATLGRVKPKTVADALIRLGMASPARTCIIVLQDWLNQGESARMNVPGTPSGNWTYRVEKKALSGELADEMRATTAAFGRLMGAAKV